MKYQRIAALLAMIVAVMAMPQNLEAKDKKVKYLGHNYQGAVDNNKVPAGNGTMNVSGLLIEGIFDGHSATDAEVWRTSYLGTSTTSFKGTVTYDESENITLKAGGTISTTYYYGKYGKYDNKGYVKETLKEDRVVNSSNFEPQSIKKSFTFRPEIYSVLNPPSEFTANYTLTLQDYEHSEKGTDGYYRTVKEKRFLDLEDKEKEKYKVISNYKDGEGRIWSYKKNEDRGGGSYSVKYPDGSIFSDYGLPGVNSWEIHYPDGTIIKKGKNDVLDFGNGFYGLYHGKHANEFVELRKLSTFSISNTSETVYSDYYDFESLSSKEGEKIIREKLLPLFSKKDDEHFELSIVKVGEGYSGDGYSGVSAAQKYGTYKNGKYTSNKEVEVAKNAAEAKEKEKVFASLTKRFGFNPSTKKFGELVCVGRSFSLLKDYFSYLGRYTYTERLYFELSKDRGSSKGYRITRYDKTVGFVWVAGDKITAVNWYK